jgi:hypothetical protein
MGYAKEGQNTKGIHMRLFSRAFVFDDGLKRNVFVSADCGMIDQLIKIEVSLNLSNNFALSSPLIFVKDKFIRIDFKQFCIVIAFELHDLMINCHSQQIQVLFF